MSDDPLKKMLEDALKQVADRDSAQKSARQRAEEDMKTSGEQLRRRVLPRLSAAQKAWEGKLKLDVADNSDQYSVGASGSRKYPSITASASGQGQAAYIFVTHSPGYVSVQEGSGPNRGNNVYEFNVSSLDDLTDEKIDEILQALLQAALGLKSKR